MFSIIICSISPERLSRLKENIEETIGVEHEIIAFDNQELKWPIAKVYNEGARRARHPYLFFVHEDVRFHTLGWGEVIAGKLKEPDCGVIGFAGSKIKLKTYTGWPQIPQLNCSFLYQREPAKTNFAVFNVHLEHPFEEVVCLDGLGLFVTKTLWEQYPFDEKMLTGFHCYDLDFSMQIARSRKYKNYVCTTPRVLIEHFSLGTLDKVWMREIIRMHKQKWNAFLPLKTSDVELSEKTEQKMEEKYFHVFVQHLLRSDYPDKWNVLKEFMASSPLSLKHFGHCFKALNTFLRKRKYTLERNKDVIAVSRYFDAAWYATHYQNIPGDPALHFLEKGWKEGKDPSPAFSTGAYLATNPDVCAHQLNPLLHYELKGRKHKRPTYSVAEAESRALQEKDVACMQGLRGDGKLILLVTHELTLTGAPRALLYMAMKLKEQGMTPVVLSLKEGPMEAEMKALGIHLFVTPFLYAQLRFKDERAARFFSAFDTVLLNTLATLALAEFLPQSHARKILWLHEGSVSYQIYGRFSNFPALFDSFDHIYAAGKYAESFASRYVVDKKKLDTLLYGLPDQANALKGQVTDGKVHFLLAGTIGHRKGHKVLLSSLKYLPQDIQKQITISIAGASMNRRITKRVKHSRFSCMQYLGELEHSKLLEVFQHTDVILCPSLDDPMPIVCTEGMMFSKTLIVSDRTGTASFIDNGVNGFVIPANDPKALADAICQSVAHRAELQQMGEAARQIYESSFTMERFGRQLASIFPG